MTTIQLHLPRPHPCQAEVIRQARRFNVLVCGRRWGKTTLGINRLIGPALEGYPVAWFSPTYRMLTEVWRETVRILRPVTARSNAQERRLDLISGGLIDFWSLDRPDVARGRKYRRVIIDEAALVRSLDDAWQAVIRATLTDLQGDAWFLSTPKGFNFFKVLFDRGQDPAEPDWASWQLPTATNPHIHPDELADLRRTLPERIYAQEFLAQFVELAGSVFRRINDLATASPQTEAAAGHQYVIGVDWGKFNDFTAFAVLDAETRELVALERFNQIDYQLQTGRLKALCARFSPEAIIAERNAMGEPIIEQLLSEGYPVRPFLMTSGSKQQAVDALALAFERGDLRILPDPVLLGELEAFEATRLPSGLLRYGAPEGGHDDTVVALMLAWQGIVAGMSDIATIYYLTTCPSCGVQQPVPPWQGTRPCQRCGTLLRSAPPAVEDGELANPWANVYRRSDGSARGT